MDSQRTIWSNGDRIYEIKTNGNKYTYIRLDQEFNPMKGEKEDIFTSDKAPNIFFGNERGEQIIYSPMGETVQEGGKSRKKRKHNKKSVRKHKRKSVRKHKRKSTRKRRRTTTKHDY